MALRASHLIQPRTSVLIDAKDMVVESIPEPNAFQRLVADLTTMLGPCSGLDSAEVDLHMIMKAMEGYRSDVEHWAQYAFEDSNKALTRNLVDEGNGKSNLLVLVWTPGRGTPIHDHAGSHCIMKILRGSLIETLYDRPENSDTGNGEARSLEMRQRKVWKQDQTTYMCDDLGLHKVSTPQNTNEFAVSLHLYTPPNAARDGFRTFDEKTGASTFIQEYHYDSEMGRKLA